MSSVTKKSVKPESLLNTEVSVSVSDRNKKNITTHTHTHKKKIIKKSQWHKETAQETNKGQWPENKIILHRGT